MDWLNDLILYVPVNNLSVTSGQVFLGWNSTKLWLMCLAQAHNTVIPVRLKPAALRSRVKHSTTAPLRTNWVDEDLFWAKVPTLNWSILSFEFKTCTSKCCVANWYRYVVSMQKVVKLFLKSSLARILIGYKSKFKVQLSNSILASISKPYVASFGISSRPSLLQQIHFGVTGI